MTIEIPRWGFVVLGASVVYMLAVSIAAATLLAAVMVGAL